MPRANEAALLEVRDLVVGYGAAPVLDRVSLRIEAGQFTVLLGRNGAGKSTFLHAIFGLIPKWGGQVLFGGVDITASSPVEIIRAGAVLVLEHHRVFVNLSVEDNLLIGTYARHPAGDRSKLDRMYAMFPEIADFRHHQASRLSGGQQEILAIAQGIIAEPDLLVLDEPSGGLAPVIIDRIFSTVAELCRGGMSVLLVEQLVEKALRHADYGYLLDNARVAVEGTPAELHGTGSLHEVYLGKSAPRPGP